MEDGRWGEEAEGRDRVPGAAASSASLYFSEDAAPCSEPLLPQTAPIEWSLATERNAKSLSQPLFVTEEQQNKNLH